MVQCICINNDWRITMNNTSTIYIGHIGWNGASKHAVSVDECNCDKFAGTHSHRDAYAICAPNNGMHYRIGGVTRIQHQTPTTENVTCKKCLVWLDWRNSQ